MKKLLLTTALVALVSPAFAAEKGPTVTLGGSLDTQFGYRQQKSNYRYTTFNANSNPAGSQLTKGGLVNDTNISVKVDGQAHGFKYGGMVLLNADASVNNKYGNPSIAQQTMVYGEAKFGRLEAGTYTGVADALSVSAANIARATGGIAGDARYWWNPSIITAPLATTASAGTTALVANTFTVTPALISNQDTGNTANATKISYYTPKYMGVKLGLSYIPDTEQSGTIANLSGLTRTLSATGSQFAYRDVFSGGIMFDHKMNDVTFKASLLGETGRAKDMTTNSSAIAAVNTANAVLTTFGAPGGLIPVPNAITAKRHNLSAWEIGGAVSFKGFSVAASYGDLGKSGNVKTSTNGNTVTSYKSTRSSYWTVGAAYEYSHFGASVTYMQSKRGNSAGQPSTSTAAMPKAQFNNLSFGVDYRVAPGFMPYAEVSAFKLDSKVVGAPKNTGNVFLAGTKLNF